MRSSGSALRRGAREFGGAAIPYQSEEDVTYQGVARQGDGALSDIRRGPERGNKSLLIGGPLGGRSKDQRTILEWARAGDLVSPVRIVCGAKPRARD